MATGAGSGAGTKGYALLLATISEMRNKAA